MLAAHLYLTAYSPKSFLFIFAYQYISVVYMLIIRCLTRCEGSAFPSLSSPPHTLLLAVHVVIMHTSTLGRRNRSGFTIYFCT
jgi:hypothetical protein